MVCEAKYQSRNRHICKNDPYPFPIRQAYAKNPLVYAPYTLTQHEAKTQGKKNRGFLSIMTTYIVQRITTLPPKNALKMEHSTLRRLQWESKAFQYVEAVKSDDLFNDLPFEI